MPEDGEKLVPEGIACCGHQSGELMFDDDPIATQECRERFARAGGHGLYGTVRTIAGAQEIRYRIPLRLRGDF